MLDESTVNKLWAKFRTTVAPDIDPKFSPFIMDETRNVLAQAVQDGMDPAGYVEADEDRFLNEIARRVRDRLDDVGVASSRLSPMAQDIADFQKKHGLA